MQNDKLREILGRWLEILGKKWGSTLTDSYDEGYCNGQTHVLSIILKRLYRK
jgi:hypothetical protein